MEKQKNEEQIKDLDTSNQCYFTDGSKSQGCNFVGFSSVTSTAQMSELYRTFNDASIFTAGAMTIILTLEEIKQRQDKYCSIFSDSNSVLENLCSVSLFGQPDPLSLTIKEKLLVFLLEEAGKQFTSTGYLPT
jgi:hypothetical protein